MKNFQSALNFIVSEDLPVSGMFDDLIPQQGHSRDLFAEAGINPQDNAIAESLPFLIGALVTGVIFIALTSCILKFYKRLKNDPAVRARCKRFIYRIFPFVLFFGGSFLFFYGLEHFFSCSDMRPIRGRTGGRICNVRDGAAFLMSAGLTLSLSSYFLFKKMR